MNRHWKLLAALVVIVFSVVWLVHSFRAPSRNSVQAYEALIGTKLAEETARLVGPSGRVLVLVPASVAVNSLEPQLAALRRRADIAVESLTIDPMAMQAGAPAIAASEYHRVLARHSETAVVVSLAGLPAVADGAIPAKRPKLVVLCATPVSVAPLLEAGWVDCAIVPRVQPIPGVGGTPAARFECEYEIRRQ